MKKTIVPLLATAVLSIACTQDRSDSIVARLIRYEVRPEFQAAFRQALSDYVSHSLESETNVLSEAYYEQADTTVLWVIERWSNKDGLNKASKSSAFKTIESLSGNSLKQPVKMIYVKDLEPLSKQQWRNVRQKTRPAAYHYVVCGCKTRNGK